MDSVDVHHLAVQEAAAQPRHQPKNDDVIATIHERFRASSVRHDPSIDPRECIDHV